LEEKKQVCMKLPTSRPFRYTLLVIALCIVGWLYVFFVRSPCKLEETTYLNVYPNESQEQVLNRLRDVGHVGHLGNLRLLLTMVGYKKNVHPGHYELTPGISPLRMVRILRSGLQTPVRLTFNNIRTVQELSSRLSEQLMADSTILLNCFQEKAWRDSMQLTDYNYMCVFIPDTYEVYWNITPEKLRAKFIHAYRQFWNSSRLKSAEKLHLTPAEVTTLASIVEEETKKIDEMPKVAGLYLNRLRIGMPLQADPTVKFAVGDFAIKRILREHTRVRSPYNTYTHIGLPPGPIRIPSIRAIDAALRPSEHPYLYMCARNDFSGYHAFATTYQQHEANAVQYRMTLNKHGIMR
jgi:UPF0755 protein